MMYDGTHKAVEDVVVGDLVMGPDSKPRAVLSTTTGEGELYQVQQTSAMDYVVNSDHILSLKKSKSSSKDVRIMPSGNPRSPRGRYPDWPEVTNISIKDYLSQSNRWKENFRGYRAGLIEFKPQATPVDPYLLGLWLGDGLHREMLITSADKEIVQWLQEYADSNGAKLTANKKSGQSNSAKDYRVVKKEGRENPIWKGFKELGVVSNKHIPQVYISNSKEIRLDLLAGLIDTDGSYSSHGYSVTSANETLAKSIKHLADTLGYRTSIVEKKTKCGDYRGRCWRISINGDVWDIPCRIKRKKYEHNGINPNKDKTLSYLKVQPIGVGKYYGFSVDGDRLFCLEDGTVTHNSWSFARALLLLGVSKPIRVLCAREVQHSIKQSVHKLLKDQIPLLGLDSEYQVLETEIRGKNGSEFSFTGLSALTVDTIKSFEGVDICWVEEGQTISDRSWQILIPTIRKEGSEIWISYNPDLESDETHQRFTINPPPDCVNVLINWRDNPWFSGVLNRERLHCKEHDPDNYDNIWEGKCRPAVEGAIYYRQMQQMEEQCRICNVPHDELLRTHLVLDLGWEDSVAIGMFQKSASEIRLIDYIEDSHKTLAEYSAMIKERKYNWGRVILPHDGHSKSVDTGMSSADVMYKLGWDVVSRIDTGMLSVEEGIKATRLMFPRLYIDKVNCERLVECLKRYRRNVNRTTGAPGSPVHDEFSHGADMLRYAALNTDNMQNFIIPITSAMIEPEYEASY